MVSIWIRSTMKLEVKKTQKEVGIGPAKFKGYKYGLGPDFLELKVRRRR